MAVSAMVEDSAWLGKLRGELCALIAPVFAQARSRFAAFAYVAALLAVTGDRKSCWQLGEQAGHATPRRMQALLAEYAWDWGGGRGGGRRGPPARGGVRAPRPGPPGAGGGGRGGLPLSPPPPLPPPGGFR